MNKTSDNTVIVVNPNTSEGTFYPPTPTDVSEIISSIFLNYVSTAVGALISPVGVAASLIDVIIYWRQGITESVNVTFFSLSLWNLVTCFLACLCEICKTIEKFAPFQSVNLMSVQFVYFSYTRGVLYILTTFVTVYLSVERCICITIPFRVKDIFTTPRVILVNLIIVLLGIACFSPGWATQGIHLVFNPKTKNTRLDLWVSANRSGIEDFIDIFSGIALPVLAQIVIAGSTGCTLHGINKSKKFRQKYAKREHAASENYTDRVYSATLTSSSDKRRKIMTIKEMKLTKVVILMALVFLACNLPLFTISCVKVFISDINVDTQHFNTYTTVYNVAFGLRVVNCVVNMLVYYKVSLRYKKEFLTLFTSSCLIAKTG